ncbi:MAG TPA: hemagglutinin repeat-containing protein, partial [Candidatus Saccharimonadales bacterium]|nr:hemagglutinin repeat-containing protein [Candidatus Saccharimonadales bacterium]
MAGDVQRGGEVKDDRLKALYAAKAAYDAKDLASLDPGAYQAASQDNANGINLQVGIDGSTASSETRTHDETSEGSAIRSQGDVTIAATGGDLNLVGSTVGGNNVTLAAAHDINIQSQAEHHTLQNASQNASGGVGLQIGTDGIGYAQASMGKGQAHGNGTTHAESHVDASGTLSLVAGNDATLQGAQLAGETVRANVGHDLNVLSEQDTGDYASKQWQAGGKVVIGYGSGASASYSQSKADSHYASVNEVTGLQAGAGGYQIHVGDSTHLVGGQLASTADPGQNVLDTGNLIAQRLHNESKYGASSVGVSGGYGAGSGFSGGLSLGVPQHGNTNSDTVSGVAAGTVIVRDGSGEGDLNRNQVTLDGNGIRNGFDAQKVQ